MSYVDGFVLPVPRNKLAAYRRMAKKGGKIWLEHGALEYRECVADDVKPGKTTSFPQAVKLKPGEVVVFSWIVYKSKADRNRANKKVMSDPRLAEFMDPKNMPFDARQVPGGDLWQIFVNDPNGVMIELNYEAAKEQGGSAPRMRTDDVGRR